MPNDLIERAIEELQEAAVEPSRWPDALRALSDALSMETSDIFGLSPVGTVAFHWHPGTRRSRDRNIREVVDRVGKRGGLPDEASEQATLVLPAYVSRGRPVSPNDDILSGDGSGDMLSVKLLEHHQETVWLRSRRSGGAGPVTSDERVTFLELARHARQAVRVTLHTYRRSSQERLRVLEAGDVTAFICDVQGRVLECTASAEALAITDRRLWLSAGRLMVHHAGDEGPITPFIQEHLTSGGSAPMLMLGGAKRPHLVLDIITLSPATATGLADPRVMIRIRSSRVGHDTVARLRSLFRLSPAQANIAVELLNGRSPEEVALARRVAPATIRSHVRGLYAKLGAESQLSFAALTRAALV